MKNWRMKKAWTVTLLCLLISGAMLLGGCGETEKPKTTEAETTTQEKATEEEVKAPEETTTEEAAKEETTTPEEKATEKTDAEDAEAEAKAEDKEAEAKAEGEDAEAEVQGEGDSPEGESAEGEGDSAAQGEGDSAEGESEGGDPGGSSDSTPAAAPEMEGNVVYKFLIEKEVSTSLGAMEQFTAYIELYDAPNDFDETALIAVCQGSSASYTTATWSEDEDGTLKIPVDEFTVYSTTDIDGVKTFTGIRYSAGMMSNGVVDIPMVDVDTPTPVFGNEEAEAGEGDAAAAVQGEGDSPAGEGGDSEGGDSEGGDSPAEAETEAPKNN